MWASKAVAKGRSRKSRNRCLTRIFSSPEQCVPEVAEYAVHEVYGLLYISILIEERVLTCIAFIGVNVVNIEGVLVIELVVYHELEVLPGRTLKVPPAQ